MTGTFSISGLSSGIDTASLISQLMTVAAQPQTALKNQLSAEQNVISTYQAINTKLSALQAAADAVTQAGTWSATKASSSSTSVVASTNSSATAGSSTTFNVTQLATAQISTVAVTGAAVSTPANGIDIVDSTGTAHHVNLTDGSAAGVAAAVNSAGVGVNAAVVNTDSGPVLQFTSATTGSAGAFSVAGLDGSPQTLVAAQNAQVTVGTPGSGGYTVSSSSNTFNNVIPGVTFSVSALATGVSVAVASDPSAISDKIKALVDSANAVLTEIGNDTGKGGALEGSYQFNSLVQKVLSTVSHGDATSSSYSAIGVQLTSTGGLKFDAAAFAAAYTANPVTTKAAASGTLATAMSSLASNFSTSTLAPMISSGTSEVAGLNKQISTWDTRLASQQTALQQKYTAMEVALQKLSSTSTYLTGALNALTNSNSNSKSN
ncbi:MAG: flagellar filament capping protein FliD [Jatrophihabitantaceae bacterium]